MPDPEPVPAPQLTTVEATPTAVVRATVATAELPAFFDHSFASLATVLAQQSLTPTGPAFAFSLRPPGHTSELEVGFPIACPVRPDGEVVPSALPAGRVATVVHSGGYDGLPAAWSELQQWVDRQGLRTAAGSWDVYLTEPTPHGDPAGNVTQLFQPLHED